MNYYDDPFLQKVVKHYTVMTGKASIKKPLQCLKVSFRWKKLADDAAVPEKRPYMMHYDGHRNRIDRIVRPKETEILEQEVFGELLFDPQKSPWVKLVKCC